MQSTINVQNWTDEELADEMVAWARGGEGARLPVDWCLEATQEYERRIGATPRDELYEAFKDELVAARRRRTISPGGSF